MGAIKDLSDLKIGLVLSGGGAKGAYETGVFRALWELQLVNQIKIISGTSIGAVNGLLFAMNDQDACHNSWSNLSYSRFIFRQENSRKNKVTELLSRVKNIGNDQGIIDQLKGGDIALLSQSGVEDFIEEYVDMNVIRNSGKTIYACAYNIDKDRPEYFCLNDYTEEEMKTIVLASCAIPYIFKPITFKNYRYADGGINVYTRARHNADNVPLKPLKTHQCDIIIVVHLCNRVQNGFRDMDLKNVVEIYPSASLEFINGIGTINMNKSTLYQNIQLGYRDAMVILAPIIISIMKGKSIEEAIKTFKEKELDLFMKNYKGK